MTEDAIERRLGGIENRLKRIEDCFLAVEMRIETFAAKRYVIRTARLQTGITLTGMAALLAMFEVL